MAKKPAGVGCGRFLIVTHEGVIKSLIYRLYHRSYLPDEPALIKSQHLHWLMAGKNGLQIEKINALALL
jgi:probable phosphoglycerate mutase